MVKENCNDEQRLLKGNSMPNETRAKKHTPHTQGYKSRLSVAYTDGLEGRPYAKHHGPVTSKAHAAWVQGKRDKMLAQARAILAKVQS